MLLYSDGNRIICTCLFLNRRKQDVPPRRAGFLFDRDRNFWYTNSPGVARSLGPHLDARDHDIINDFEDAQRRRAEGRPLIDADSLLLVWCRQVQEDASDHFTEVARKSPPRGFSRADSLLLDCCRQIQEDAARVDRKRASQVRSR